MAIDRYISQLTGSAKEIREIIKDVVDSNPRFFTSYVMAVDANDETLWCCQPGDYDERTNLKVKGLAKVYVWLSHIGCQSPIEGIYQK